MKRPNPHTLPPDFRSKEEESTIRKNKVVVYMSDKEISVLNRYQSMLKSRSKASICREAIMEKALNILDENTPTLF